MELSRFRKSNCLLVVIRITVFDLNTICPTNDELARYVLVATLVLSEAETHRKC
jgi:hypothetical protein